MRTILIVGLPRHDKVAVLQRGHFRISLVIIRIGIDLELATKGLPIGIMNSTIDALVLAILIKNPRSSQDNRWPGLPLTGFAGRMPYRC